MGNPEYTVMIRLREIVSTKSIGSVLLCGLVVRLLTLSYIVFHDLFVDHIKLTDIDYQVFTNGTRAIIEGRSPYDDQEYRYTPIVALVFVPNLLLGQYFGKILLITADIACAYLIYILNVFQGTHRVNTKVYLVLWLINPFTVGISTRGSFEPILLLIILASLYLLESNSYVLSGLLYGLSIHIKLYPIIYAPALYMFIIQRKPYLITQNRVSYWIKTTAPNVNHVKFFTNSVIALVACTYLSYRHYGHEYLYQSFTYHLERKDTQHNFSVYFYLFKQYPDHQDLMSKLAFFIQFLCIMKSTLDYVNFDTNRRTKLRKLNFSLFCSTFAFVSLNKVITAQYFNWFLIFLPLILDNIKISEYQGTSVIAFWLASQVCWLFLAYLYEYQGYQVLFGVWLASIWCLFTNCMILVRLRSLFDPTTKLQLKDNE